MNKEEQNRDENGDIKFNFGKVDMGAIRKAQYTYIFKYYDTEREYYLPYFNLFSSTDDFIEQAKQNPEFYERRLYPMPDQPPYDVYIEKYNGYLGLLVEFFKEVFEEKAFLYGHQPSHKFFSIILLKSIHERILECVKEFGLEPIEDLLFEIIAIAQNKYIEDISFWERPEMQKLVTSAVAEAKKVTNVLEKLDDTEWLRGTSGAKAPSKLLRINFVFNDETIKVEHEWLANEFVEYFKQHYSDLPYKNWKLNLEAYPKRFEDNIKAEQFKYKLAKSLYNLLTETKLFTITKAKPYPNKLMLCIGRLIKFCLIPVGDADDIDAIKIKHIRNWLQRNTLTPDITFAEVPPDYERLTKYFEPEFIRLTGDIKRADALSIALRLGKQFTIEKLVPDLAHIAQALLESRFFIGHQILSNGISKPAFEEFDNLSTLINGIRSNKKLETIKYKLEGDDTEYELTQRLPMYLLEESIKSYSEDHQVEFDTEPVKTTVIQNSNGSVTVVKGKEFLNPDERFMVRFVKSFCDYLLAEAPPDERDLIPSTRYYSIIANMLQQTWFFYHQRHSETFIVHKVKEWHKLALHNGK